MLAIPILFFFVSFHFLFQLCFLWYLMGNTVVGLALKLTWSIGRLDSEVVYQPGHLTQITFTFFIFLFFIDAPFRRTMVLFAKLVSRDSRISPSLFHFFYIINNTLQNGLWN